MPLLQGEVSLLSLYADVHYYFNSPNSKPAHHRFDRRSYLYLYHDALNRRGRIEIANHPGTPDQDAFHGYLDSSNVQYSHKQPTLFTITVHSRTPQTGTPSPQHDASQWHLLGPDIHNEGRYLIPLQTVDIYLWTMDDAGLFADSLKRVLAPGQLRILDGNTTHAEHRDSMSPVVQLLEKVAITTPQPQQGVVAQAGGAPQAAAGADPQRSNSISTAQTGSPSASTPTAGSAHTPSTALTTESATFAPMAYNPAAPAAPEPIAHREKTPPPPDAEAGTGLNSVAVQDSNSAAMHPHQQQQAVNPLQQQFAPQQTSGTYQMAGVAQAGSIPPPPPGQPGIQRANTLSQPGMPTIPGPPPPAQAQGQAQSPYAPAFAGPPTDTYAPQQQAQQGLPPPPPGQPGLVRQNTLPTGGYQQQYPPQQQQYAQYAQSSPVQAPVQGYGALPSPALQHQGFSPVAGGHPGHMQASGQQYVPGPAPQLQQQQPQQATPPGAPGAYVPGQQQPQQQYGINHNIHQQLYYPEGSDAAAQQGPGQPGATGRLEANMSKAEKGVTSRVGRFLKKVDKKI